MKMIQEQWKFLLDLKRLIEFIEKQKMMVTGGELWRTPEMQEIYLKEGKSKTKNSMHLNRLAIDLNFFTVEGEIPINKRERIKPIGDYWESLDERNFWGGSWRGAIESGKSTWYDLPHFERKI